ncbi:hypothetical protein BGZ90_009258, partial [Linnemannia elongata]
MRLHGAASTNKPTTQAEQAGVISLPGIADATQTAVSRVRPTLWPMSFLTRYLKSITKVKRPDTHSPTGTTNATPALEHSSRLTLQQVSKPRLAEQSTDAQAAYQFVHDSLELDSRPNLNMASYVHTWMEPEADKLIMENINKNLCDQGEYPATTEIHRRCISIIGDLWNSNDAVGSST